MKKLDGGMLTYLTILILSWVVIIIYILSLNQDDMIKKELESYPFDHSQITDTTLKKK